MRAGTLLEETIMAQQTFDIDSTRAIQAESLAPGDRVMILVRPEEPKNSRLRPGYLTTHGSVSRFRVYYSVLVVVQAEPKHLSVASDGTVAGDYVAVRFGGVEDTLYLRPESWVPRE